VLKRLRFQAAAGAGGVGLRGPQRGVGSQVALPSSHVMNSSSRELVQAHEGSRVYGRWVVVVRRQGEQLRPVFYERFPELLLQGRVRVRHQGRWGEEVSKLREQVCVDHWHSG